MICTRFAPSPTGDLHIGGARTALFSWAYARHHGGKFILRIEDTDLARSTPEAVRAILDGMAWLGLAHDEGPFYQTRRMGRYREVLAQMLAAGTAYHCYATPEELEALRAEQEAKREKPRYDGRWRPEPGKVLPSAPPGVNPVVRFRSPREGIVTWDDLVKGRIEIANHELDDLVLARADGTPTYNFCVVVDDWDMGITHVLRGDDHVNNTPRQINILKALDAPIPRYAHLSMILGPDGKKLSKRHGAVSVMQYAEDGYLPEAVINYLARLGWSHGDDEIFSREKLVEWFSLDHITASSAQFDFEKLKWINQHYMKEAPVERLEPLVVARLEKRGFDLARGPDLKAAITLYVDRCNTLEALAKALEPLYTPVAPDAGLIRQHLDDSARPALAAFATGLETVAWEAPAIGELLKATLKAHGLKMPRLAMPLRIILTGQAHTPSVDTVITLIGRETVLARLREYRS
ncbi:MAG: glutamate--tRNA ligase [Zoogloeaceae bacterium]|jgi:glutamyl-tRNA synthetase|nr:glutamate--tRNA ligase [Zoogloeaceae bacterium]